MHAGILAGVDVKTRLEIVEILNDMHQREMIEAEIRQEEIARANHQRGPRRVVDGIGEQTMSIDPAIYWAHRIRNNRSWSDKDWTRWLLRRNPEFRVKNAPSKTRIGPTRFTPPPFILSRDFGHKTSQFSKRYA